MLTILKKYVNVDVYSDYRQMMDNVELDFVVISTPSDSHSEIIDYAIKKKLHIFTEKPFAMTSAEGEKTITEVKVVTTGQSSRVRQSLQ